MVCDLVGRSGPTLGSGCLVGLRTTSRQAVADGEEQNPEELRVKVIFDAEGAVEFYNLGEDPMESENLADQQINGVNAARARAEASLKDFECEAVELPAWEQEALRSLGYLEP